LTDADDRHRGIAELELRVAVLRPLAQTAGSVDHLLEDGGGSRTVQPHAAQARGQRADADIFSEDELLEALKRRLEGLRRHVKQDHAARLEHVHVGEHAALRRQPGGITSRARCEPLDVVGQQALKVGSAVLPGDGNLQPQGSGPNCRLLLNSPVAVLKSHRQYRTDTIVEVSFFRYFVHCTCVFLLGLPTFAAAQPQAASTQRATGYLVFVRGNPVGRELVTVNRDQNGIAITSQGRMLAPLNVTVRNAEFRYRSNWTPTSFTLDATVNDSVLQLKTTFADGKAATEGIAPGQPVSVAHAVAPRTLVHANGVFGSYIALAGRLVEDSEEGAEFRVYVVPQLEITVTVKAIHRERMQIGTTVLDVRRYELVYGNPAGDVAINLTANDDGGLIRVNIPSDSLDIVREDVASSTSRTQIHSNPGDEAVIIPAVGFNIGATLTRPAKSAPGTKLAAVVVLAGSGVGDRDGVVQGVPTLAQMAGAIAESGMLAVRYDKRGNGQSGGRSESATVSDFAEDVRGVVRWLEKRPDVDPKRVAVVGHSEGAWVGLLAASRERRIAAVVSIAGPSSTGAELVLEQQRHALEQMKLPAEERDKRIALQQQINSAVLTGKGWDTVPPQLRKEADTLWFQSLLTFDPAKVLDDVRQPMLFVHGALDRQVPVEHVERLSDMARKESRSRAVEVVVVRGINHLLVPATTGEVSEYGTLADRNVSKDVTMAVTEWLKKTFASIR
jgi:pimeloyl-ACP methyl ester carboxylesterase